ncbi:MAG: DUF2934 domain-containing protein [Verrucomicrobia bacterium]|nr:DUF2934 domain-containing protein [Verrucomicrobiota bacterium]
MNDSTHPSDARPGPTENEIRELAYQLYEQGGREHGRDLDHWLKAEVALQQAAKPGSVPRKWAWHDRTLRRIRETLRREHDEHAAEARMPLPRGGADAVDVANDECEHDTLMAEISLAETELAEIDAALERIANGTYGVCEVTGQLIPEARLRAVPWARRCVAAAEKR